MQCFDCLQITVFIKDHLGKSATPEHEMTILVCNFVYCMVH